MNFLRKKFRWTFEGKNCNGEAIFPESFMKINNRPAYDGVDDIYLTQYFMFYEEEGQTKESFDEFNRSFKDVTGGILRCYDGCGNIIEDWSLKNVTVKLIQGHEDPDCIVADWKISYTESSWRNVSGPKLSGFNDVRQSDGIQSDNGCYTT